MLSSFIDRAVSLVTSSDDWAFTHYCLHLNCRNFVSGGKGTAALALRTIDCFEKEETMKQEREEKKRKKKSEETQPQGQKSGNPPKGQGPQEREHNPRPTHRAEDEDEVTDQRKRA